MVEDVAHELRTPLTTLRGYTEALADGVVEPTPEMLATVHAEIERLTRLVEGLDALARNETSARRRASAEVRLGDLVRRTLALANPELDKTFIAEAKQAGLVTLEGHRSAGGMRASLYNAMPMEGVNALVDFMKTFEQRHG